MYIPLTFEGSQAKCLFATGGYEGYFISGSQQWAYHWFTGSANLEVQKGTIDNVQILVVGGGGGGAISNTAGGGGGGGVNFNSNARLFQGTYNVSVGKGGKGGQYSGTANPGDNGVGSSIIGSNLSMAAGGGSGGGQTNILFGGASGTPTSFAGGSNSGILGGGGGGASSVGQNATNGGDGGSGLIYSIANFVQSFGCGGGGGGNTVGGAGAAGCESAGQGGWVTPTNQAKPGSNRYGGGGGGAYRSATNAGGDGGSGSVIIQYPIYDYCTNYFNETGSCGCRELTFDTSTIGNFYPDITGSYIYMPCGETQFVSGSLISYAPLTVCAVSNSYFSYTTGDNVDPIVVGVTAGFVNSGPECVSASLVPVACTPEAFVPTCTSSIVTILTPSASVGTPNTFGYVANTATTHSIYTSTSARVKYICISTGSLYAGNQIYPQVLTGDYASLYNTASCNTTTFTFSGTAFGSRTYRYYNCNGLYGQGVLGGNTSITLCIDTTAPFGFYGTTTNTSVTIGADCLSGSNIPYCGCQTVYNIQNCLSASVTASITISGSASLQTGSTITSNVSGLSGSCWSVINSFIPISGGFIPTYNNVVTASTYSDCDACVSPIVGKYNIIDCNTSTNYVSTFSSIPTLGTIFKSNDLEKCFTISSLASASVPADYSNLSIVETYANCATCLATSASLLISTLVVAGGGSGGSGNADIGAGGGGGGAGGYIANTASLNLNQSYTIEVGDGGIGDSNKGTNGVSSSAFGYTAVGGGAGGAFGDVNGNTGGSGGGGHWGGLGGSGSAGQGNNGASGSAFQSLSGGGGGALTAGSPGNTTSNGGSGSVWIDGIRYAGGGGGWRRVASLQSSNGLGGPGGGGVGGQNEEVDLGTLRLSTSGSTNTGGGGGGSWNSTNGGNGGSGIVKIRYAASSSVATGGEITISGSYVYHTFTGSGNFIT
jgi:hypothetical protein